MLVSVRFKGFKSFPVRTSQPTLCDAFVLIGVAYFFSGYVNGRDQQATANKNSAPAARLGDLQYARLNGNVFRSAVFQGYILRC